MGKTFHEAETKVGWLKNKVKEIVSLVPHFKNASINLLPENPSAAKRFMND